MRKGLYEASFVMRAGTRPSTCAYDGIDEQLCDINSLYSALEDNHHMDQLHFTEWMACSTSMAVFIWSLIVFLVNSLIAEYDNHPVGLVIQNGVASSLQRLRPVYIPPA